MSFVSGPLIFNRLVTDLTLKGMVSSKKFINISARQEIELKCVLGLRTASPFEIKSPLILSSTSDLLRDIRLQHEQARDAFCVHLPQYS